MIEATGALGVDVGWVNGNYQRILFPQRPDRVSRSGMQDGGPTPSPRAGVLLHQAWRDTLDQAVDRYGKLLDRSRKRVDDRPSDTIADAAFRGQAVRIVAYLRVSTAQQDVRSQRLAILEYARQHDFRIDDFIEATASRQASEKRRRLDELLNGLQRGGPLCAVHRRGPRLAAVGGGDGRGRAHGGGGVRSPRSLLSAS